MMDDPFNCPKCGAHDYGLFAASMLGCPHCLKEESAARIAKLEQQNAALQARIDALMLEHCPDEISPEQLANWASHQVMAPELESEGAKDARRLHFVCEMMDGIGDIDFHEEAAINASVFGRDEANFYDYLAAVRTAIDAAMKSPAK